jgi:hypothetical protein
MEGCTPMLNSYIKQKFNTLLVVDGVTPDKYDDLIILYDAISPSILITDISLPCINSFNYTNKEPINIDDKLYIHNPSTLIYINDNNENILISPSSVISSNNKFKLVCFLGPTFYGQPLIRKTWFGITNNIPWCMNGGQNTNHLWWSLLMFNKDTNILEAGIHSFAWLMFNSPGMNLKENNPQSIFNYSKIK